MAPEILSPEELGSIAGRAGGRFRRVAIHQPNFLPWLGYFHKMASVDCFVLLDDAQFVKEGFVHRNRIKTPQGAVWIGLPVLTRGRFAQSIIDTEVASDARWRKKLVMTFQQSYARAPHANDYLPALEQAITQAGHKILEFNLPLLDFARRALGIDTPVIRSSQLDGIEGKSTERLISICKRLGAEEYLSGHGGKNYQDEVLYAEAGIQLTYVRFSHPTYPQLWGEFVPSMSVVDLLFNSGPEARSILFAQKSAAS
jgi:hypothetical protein